MGVKPLLGRAFTHEESGDADGAHPVVIISARPWRDYFHSDAAAVGKTVRVNRYPLTIVGVAPAEFRGSWPVMQFDLWVPVTMGQTLGLPGSSSEDRSGRGTLESIGRLRTGVPVERARAEAAALAANLAATYPKTNRGVGATVLRSWEQHNGVNEYLRAPLTILLAVSFVVLLVVCANVANLLLARAVGRQREFAIRFALGARRTQVAIQVFAETLILAVGGAAVGLLMLLWMQESLVALVPSVGFPLGVSGGMNGRILAFTALVCLATAAIAGTSPALFVFHSNLNEVLKEGSRSDTAGAASRRTRSMLVVGEVALATVALVGAGLFVRSFRNIRATQTGFQSDHVLFGRFFIETSGYTGDQIQQFSARLKRRLLAASGVNAVSYTDFVPLSATAGPYDSVQVEGYTPAPGERPAVNRALVSPDYFATMRIPILEGRDFTVQDDGAAEAVMIVNQTFARRFFHGESPIGRKVRADGKWARVVGLARDSKYYSPSEPATPFSITPLPSSTMAAPSFTF